MMALVAAVFMASLLGSLHCAGMCGGVVALCLGVSDEEKSPHTRLLVAYNGGRLLTYVVLGVMAGAAGAALDAGGATLFGAQRIAAGIAGGLMMTAGLVALLRMCGLKWGRFALPHSVDRLLRRGYDLAFRLSPTWRALLIGTLTGLLPCGWLWAFVFAAGGTGDPLLGGLTMAVFWSGTLPVMLAVGAGIQTLTGRLRRHLPLATSVLLILVGGTTVAGRLHMPALAPSSTSIAQTEHATHGSALERARAGIESIDQTEMSCCNDSDINSE